MIKTTYSEADAESLINTRLRESGWKEEQITRQSHRPETRKLLGRLRPDYVLYGTDSIRPLAVVEAKKEGGNLQKALKQGMTYAKKLKSSGCVAVFASDGDLVRTAHVADGKPLIINGEEVREFLSERMLCNFTNDSMWSRGRTVKNSRSLIYIFKTASRDLRAEGLANIDAFVEFSQILFIKIIGEICADEPERGAPPVDWRDIADKRGKRKLEAYNQALDKLRSYYPDMFGLTEIKKPETLERIVDKIDGYSFIDIDADVKGDAYEYFLRRYNKQKSDLAQYFTPRHVVRAMVMLCNPRWGETICDPFCGTGGMLIEAFKQIKRRMPANAGEQEKSILREKTIFGADISRSADAARMNMILAGDGHSNIRRADSLDKTDHGVYDIVITNIPFGDYELDSIRHCMNIVSKDTRNAGRMCMIVPERVLDSMYPEYIAIRRQLVEEWTVKRIVSLPREVFRGLTSAKTSIIYAVYGNPRGARSRVEIPYFEVANDGYTLDKKRDPLPGENDLDVLLEDRDLSKKCTRHVCDRNSGCVLKPKIEIMKKARYPQCLLHEIARPMARSMIIAPDMSCREVGINAKTHETFLKEERLGYNVKTTKRFKILPGDLVFARMHTQNGLFAFSDGEYHATSSRLICKIDESKVDRNYLFHVLSFIVPTLSMMDTTGRENYSVEQIMGLQIPLPPLAKQRKLVANIMTAKEKLRAAETAIQKSVIKFYDDILIR